MVAIRWNAFRSIARSLVWGLFLSLALGGGTAWAQATVVDLIITKGAPTSANNNEEILYTLQLTNSGPGSADGAVFTDDIPTGLTVLGVTCDPASEFNGALCPTNLLVSGQRVTGTVSTFPNGGSVTVQIRVQVPLRGPGGNPPGLNSYSNTATLKVPANRTELNASTNSSTANTAINYRPIDLVTTVVSAPATFAVGDTLTYVIDYDNIGSGPAGKTDQVRLFFNSNADVLYATGIAMSGRSVQCEAFGGAVCPAVPTLGDVNLSSTTLNYAYAVYPPVWPAGGKLNFTYVFTVDSYLGPNCSPAGKRRSLNFTADAPVGAGLTDAVPGNNTKNSKSTGAVFALPKCPDVDLEAVKSQVDNTWAFDVPKVYTMTYTNKGPGAADGSLISDWLQPTGSGGATALNYDSAAVLSCVAGNGAECPTSFTVPAAGALGATTNLFISMMSGVVPTWPAGGTITVVYSMTPRSFSRPACGANAGTTNIRLTNQSRVAVAADLTDPVAVNNNSAGVVSNSVGVPWPRCLQADVQGVASQSAPLQFGQPLTLTYVYKNAGPDVADGSFISASRYFTPNVATNGITGFTYENGVMNCVATGNAICPTLPSFAASGSLTGTLANTNVYSNQVVDQWPAGGELTVTYTFTPTGYTGNCSGANARARVNIVATSKARAGVVSDPIVSNDASLASSLNGPLCADLVIKKSVSPAVLSPNESVSFNLDVSVPPAYGAVPNAYVEDILPAGFVFDPSVPGAVTCTVTSGTGTCPPLGGEQWDPATRKFSVVIPSVGGGSAVTYRLTGATTGFASTWRNTATIAASADGWDPLPITNSSTVSMVIQDSLPLVTKVSLDESKSVVAGGVAKYRIVVSNPTDGTPVQNVKITDSLLNGFTLLSTDSVTPSGATRTATINPAVNATSLEWGTFDMPAGSTIEILFTARVPASLSCGQTRYHNSAQVHYRLLGLDDSRQYDGTLIGNDADDVAIPCPPVLTKNISPSTVNSGAAATLTFTLTPASNSAPNLLPVTFIDTLPSGLRIQSATISTNTCGATVTRADGTALSATATDIKVSGALLPSGGTGSCQISVSITNVLGSFNELCTANPPAFTNGPGNISGLVNATNGVNNACLMVKMLRLPMVKAFNPTTILENETSKATLTITQPPGQPATTISFVDTLPAGLKMATTSVTGTCNGSNVAGYASISGKTLTVSDLPIVANPLATNATCTVIFDVTHEVGQGNASCSGSPADFTNGVVNVTGISPNLSYASNPCLVVASTPKLDKRLASKVILNGGQTQLTLTITNGLGNPAQTGINFTDNFPANWRVKDSTVQNTCGGSIFNQAGGALVAGDRGIRLTGGALVDGQETCQITVNVTNFINALNVLCSSNPAAWTNQGSNITGVSNLQQRVSAPQCLTVIDKEMTLAKRFELAGQSVTQLEASGVTVSTILTIGNPSATLALTDFELVDVLPGSSDIANDGSSPRGSTRSATLTAAVTGLPSGVTVQYSTVTNPCRSTSAGANVGGTLADLPVGCTAPNWQTTPSDYSTIRSLRFVGAGLNVAPKTGTLALSFPLLLDAAAGAGDVFANDAAATYVLGGIASSATVVRSTIAQINIATASLSGTVFEDMDRDGVQGAGEAGLPGSVIVAKCVAGPSCVVDTQWSVLTGSEGMFSFTAGATNVHANGDASGTALTAFAGLASGTWSLTEIPPASPLYLHTASASGTAGGTVSGRQIGSIVLAVGATGTGYRFGEVLAVAPALGKTFAPTTITAGDVATMTWTLTNPNLGQIATLSGALNDTMPAGMVVAVADASTTCASGSVTAVVGTSAVSLNAGAQIPAATAGGAGSCTVSVKVTASPGGVDLINTLAANALQTNVGTNASSASATLTVLVPIPATLTVTKIVTPSSVAVTGAFPFTVQCGAANYSGSVTITANNTGTTTLLIPAGSAACEVTETVKVIPTAPQNYQWLPPVYSQPAAVIAPAGGALSATITNPLQSTLVSMTKAFAPATIDEGGTSTATMTISQPAGAPAATVSLTDTLPAGLALVSSVPVGGSCAAVASHVSVSGNAVTVTNLPLADNTSAAVQTCTITFGVTHAANRANASCTGNPADFTNGSANVTNLSSNLSYSGSPCLTVTSVPQLDKRLASNTILSGQSTSLVFTITNGLGKPAQAGIDFTDGFPANWRVADAVVGNTCGGILTDQTGASIAAGQTGIRLSGGVLAVNAASCQITLNVTNATGQTNADCSANPAAWTNGKTNISGEANVLNSIAAPQCLKVVSQGITVAKAFEQGGVPVVQLESVASPVNTVLTITNPGNVAVTDFELVDVLPAASDKTVAGATRGSTRAAAITAALSGLPAGVTASYSTVANPCRSTDEGQNVGGTLPDLPAGCSAPAWQASVTDYSTVRAVRWVGTGLNVPALTGTLSMSFPLTVNAAAITGDRIANDVAVTYQVTGAAALPNVVASNVAQLDMVAASLAGLVFEDTNGNGVQDPTEVGLPGAAIAVTCDAGPGCIAGTVYSMVTAADGSFQFAAGATNVFANTTASGTPLALFTGLLSGTWSVVETPPAGTSYQNTGSVAGTVNTVASGTAAARKMGSIALPMAGVGKDYVFAEMLAPANLVVTKVVAFAPGTAAMAMNGVYSFNVTCQTPTDTYPGAITITAGNTGFANIGLPAGSSACEVTEDGQALPAAPVNTQWLPATYQQPDQGAVVAGGVLNATMTNTLASTIGGLSVSLQVQGGPAGYVPAPVPVYATCDKPVAGTRYPASGTVSAQVSAPAVIAGVPVGATCEVFRDTAAFPAAPSNYRWSKTDVQQPTGVMTSGGSLSAVVVATLAPLDPPFAQKVGKLVDKKEISWTMHLVNNNASNAGQPAAQFVLNDPVLPASGMTFVSGSVACVPFGAGQTTVSECTYDLATNTLRVAGALAYTGDTNAQTAAERVEVVFHVEVAKAGTYTNTATAQLNSVSGSPVTLTANVTVPADETDPGTVVPVPLWDMRAMLLMQALLMCLAYAALTKLRRRHRHGRGR